MLAPAGKLVPNIVSLETYGPPPDDATTVPAEAVQMIEDEISQFSEVPQAVLTTPNGGGDPSHCPSFVVRTSQTHPSNASRPGPYTVDPQNNGSADLQTKSPPKNAASSVAHKGPYAILSMFDGCGSSVDIIESKFGYRPKACILCEKDETLRYLVGEKRGITVDQRWQHSLKGGGAFYYAKDVDTLFVDNARLLREFVALGSDCYFFIIGGSPCTDLTYAGEDHGHLGICGPASVLFFTMHLAIHLITTVIPGDRIRFLVENAGSMRNEHFCFIRACLGLRQVPKANLTWCTSLISPAKRLRIFFQNNTLYEGLDAQVTSVTDLEWTQDWSPLVRFERGTLREVPLQPFMRPIAVLSDLALRYSWSSYHPSALLRRISHWHTKEGLAMMANLSSDNGIPNFQWNAIIPPIYCTAWRYLLKCFATGAPNSEKDAALRGVLPLFHNSSIHLPFRLLTDQEVLQVSGLSRNFESIVHLKHLLTPHTMRSFVGNSFHPKLISLAIGSAEDLQAWVQGKLPSITNIAVPTTVRKNYVRFRGEIIDAFARKNYTPKSTLVEEPYRHIDYRALVMSPLEAPKVAQPTVGNILPAYLTRDVAQADLRKDAETRLRVIGTSQFFKFLENSQLLPITQELAVPQWLPFTGEVANSLMHRCSLLLLSAYARGLFAYPTLPRTILFFRSLVVSNATETDGYIVVSYRYSPCQIHYLGPHKPENVYLVQLRDSIDILLFKYGGKPVQIHSLEVPHEAYIARYSYCWALHADAEACVVGIAIQQSSRVTSLESPFTRALSETGCALWRLAQCAAAKLDLLHSHACVSCCHSDLACLPLILIEGHLEGTCLSVCPATARALCAHEQAEVWQTQDPHAICILFLCQATRPAASDFYRLATITPEEQDALPALPTADSVISASKESFHATPIDRCPNLVTANGWYVCICGETARTVFWGAQALLNQQ